MSRFPKQRIISLDRVLEFVNPKVSGESMGLLAFHREHVHRYREDIILCRNLRSLLQIDIAHMQPLVTRGQLINRRPERITDTAIRPTDTPVAVAVDLFSIPFALIVTEVDGTFHVPDVT